MLMKNRILAAFLWHAGLLLAGSSAVEAADGLAIQRLTWAGVKFSTSDATVLIDAVNTDIWNGDAPGGFVPVVAETGRKYALITHTHNDHFDLEGLRQVLGEHGNVVCHESIASYVASRGLRVIPVQDYVPVSRAGFVFTAVPAEDGLGEQQVSWIVTVAGRRFLHGGDTLWHGRWSALGKQYGPFDAVFLPINGARVLRDPMPETPAVLTPAQAVDAAILLRARRLIPIHYGLNDPPGYQEVNQPLATTITEAERRGLVIEALQPGEILSR
jgi:L-ascorbate metabolism protein UlaG (beta-lactamase superfamily)